MWACTYADAATARGRQLVGELQLPHNRRVGGVTRAAVLLNLGCGDQFQVED
jgi:hypothetical protein